LAGALVAARTVSLEAKPASTSRASSSCMENPARTRGTINAVGRKIAD
jgi:hypothetical protein